MRYTLKDYAAWKGQLNVYYGDRDIYKANQGTKAEIGTDGSFDVPVSLEQITNGSYINYLKVLSAKAGELVYDIQIYIESDMVNSKGGVKGKSMVFLNLHRRKDYSRPCHWNREYGNTFHLYF